MKLGYGNYGMRGEDVFDALPRLRDIGYEAIELTVSDGWPTAPDMLNGAGRKRLAKLCESLDFPSPALLGIPSGDDPTAAFVSTCELACDLNFGEDPVVICAMPPGFGSDWAAEKQAMCDGLLEWADLAADHDAVIAVEPHVGMALDTPEKAAWLIDATNHPSLKLTFDYSHFHVMGLEMQNAFDLCMPQAAHIHIKDGRMVDGEVKFLLPGEGALDLSAYFLAMRKTGTKLPVTVEVSGMVWNSEDYDPWEAARACYEVLEEAGP